LGFVGYLLEKKFGSKLGLWMSGIFGGIVSSTAVTLSVGRMARNNPARGSTALQATLLASSVTYLRTLALIWFINGTFVPNLWLRFVFLSLIGVVLSIRMFKKESPALESEMPELQNPFEIRPAIGFALLFILLSVLTGLVKSTMGNSGLLGLAAIVGVSDITPFILSIVQGSDGSLHIFTSAIILALMSNTVAKGIYFGSLSPTTRKETALKYSIYALLHIPFIIW
jgi:uncharacterized membrane protein (DUF4010 family)